MQPSRCISTDSLQSGSSIHPSSHPLSAKNPNTAPPRPMLIGSMESQPLDQQGGPPSICFYTHSLLSLMAMTTFLQLLTETTLINLSRQFFERIFSSSQNFHGKAQNEAQENREKSKGHPAMWDSVKVKSTGMGQVSQSPPIWFHHCYCHQMLGGTAIISLQECIANYPLSLHFSTLWGRGNLHIKEGIQHVWFKE